MRMLKSMLVVLVLLIIGCRSPWEPKFGMIMGTVTYPDGVPVNTAMVSISGHGHTFSDATGRYRLKLTTPEDTVTVRARDGFTPGRAYAVTHSGSATVIMKRSIEVRDIVLDQETPI